MAFTPKNILIAALAIFPASYVSLAIYLIASFDPYFIREFWDIHLFIVSLVDAVVGVPVVLLLLRRGKLNFSNVATFSPIVAAGPFMVAALLDIQSAVGDLFGLVSEIMKFAFLGLVAGMIYWLLITPIKNSGTSTEKDSEPKSVS